MTKFKKLAIAKRLFALALTATMAFSFSSVQLFAEGVPEGNTEVQQNIDTLDSEQGGGQTNLDQTTPGGDGGQTDPDQTTPGGDGDQTNPDQTKPGDGGGQTDPDQTKPGDGDQTTPGGDSSTTPPETSSTGDSSATTGSTENTTATTGTTEATTPTTPAAEPKPVGTTIAQGSYEYQVTGTNSVMLMGFNGNAEATYVKVKNQIVDNGVTYLVTAIAPKAFMKESCIEKVLIRKNVKDIGKRAFFQCKNLNSVRIKTGLEVMRKCAFKGCKAMRVMNIHSAVVKDVKANAFKNVNTNLLINVASKSIKQMLKASVPSYITINKAFTNTSASK